MMPVLCSWRVLVALALVVATWSCQKPRAETKPGPIPGLDPGRPAAAAPAVFVRENLAATREALRAAYRLSLDARVPAAAALIAELGGRKLAQPPTVTWQGGWKIQAAANAVGELDELPDFDQANAMLVAWARRQLPSGATAVETGPGAELLLDEQAVQEARTAGKLAIARERRGGEFQRLGSALVSLAFQSFDSMQAADDLLAAAWAAMAMAEAKEAARPVDRCLLAFALGYWGAAQRMAAQLPQTSPVRAYVLFDDARLSALAEAKTDPGASYLWLRRLLVERRYEEALRWEESRLAAVRGTTPVVLAKIQWGDFSLRRQLAAQAPATVTIAAFRDAGGAPAPGKALSAFDGAVAAMANETAGAVGRAIAAYYRGSMLTALRDEGRDYLHELGSNPAAAEFARSLREDSGATATTFRSWYDYLVASNAGQNVTGKLLENVQALPGIGGMALSDVWDELQNKLDWGNPATYATARAVLRRLDTRPINRRLAGDIAYKLPDLRMSERLYRSLAQVAPSAYPGVHLFLASYTGERALIETAQALPQLQPCDRIKLLTARVQQGTLTLDKALREMEAAVDAKDEAQAVFCLADTLAVHQRFSDVARVASAWLRGHPDARGLDGVNMRRHLSFALLMQGKTEQALAAIEPAVASWQRAAMEQAAVVYAALGQADKAKALAEAATTRYPGAQSAIFQAELAWRLGQPAEAVRMLRMAKLRVLDYSQSVAPAFVRVFVRDKVPGLEAAARDVLGIREAQDAIIDAVGHADPKLAVVLIDMLTDPRARGEAALRHTHLVEKVKGSAAAEAWAREQLRGAPPSFAQGAIANHREEPLWLLPEPGPPPARELLWLLRAVAAQWHPPSRHLTALKQHYAAPGPDRYYQLGRVVMGLEDEAAGTALRGTTPSQACEVAFYLGARAQGLGKLDEAHDWYRAAIETSLPGESEYRFALAQMAIWAAQNKSLDRIAKEGSP